MLESVRCPSCLTHYGLRPERVHPGLRKARCLKCKDVFRIEEAVERLLASLAPSEPEPLEPEIPEPATLDLSEPEPLAAPLPESPEIPEDLDLQPLDDLDSALTLGDLEATEDDLLEKTLVVDPPPASSAASAEPEPLGGNYASAKDAISRLLGELPQESAREERRTAVRPNQSMDVEATLDALENTLGGITAQDLEPQRPQGSTVKLSAADIQAAMSAGSTPVRPVPAPAPTPAPVPAPVPKPLPQPPSNDAALLKVEVGNEVFQNISLDQMATWIEQGRVQEWHMVARQHSENWIEASKVPSLRPLFERMRRQQGGASADLSGAPTLDTGSTKKGLFGFLKR